ncbi:MAG: hypothetical protein ACTSUW_02910 [Candidatus Heimdallarchaeota archaeon]
MSKISMSNRNTIIKIIIASIIIVTMFSSCLVITFTPFTTRNWSVGSNSYEYKTYFYGYWNFYNNTEIVSSGGSSTLDNFLIFSPVLVIIGIVLSLILVPMSGFYLGSNGKKEGTIKRILSLLTVLVGLIGFIGVMLFLPFFNYLDNLHIETKLGVGFIFSTILFVVVTLFGIILLVLPKRNARHNSHNTRSLE